SSNNLSVFSVVAHCSREWQFLGFTSRRLSTLCGKYLSASLLVLFFQLFFSLHTRQDLYDRLLNGKLNGTEKVVIEFLHVTHTVIEITLVVFSNGAFLLDGNFPFMRLPILFTQKCRSLRIELSLQNRHKFPHMIVHILPMTFLFVKILII